MYVCSENIYMIVMAIYLLWLYVCTEMVIHVADGETGKSLVTYRAPVSSLTPFHQYHLELNMVGA